MIFQNGVGGGEGEGGVGVGRKQSAVSHKRKQVVSH